jgi:hypothetical protein
MKKVFPSSEVAHIWARQSQAKGRSTANVFFHDTRIYSYGHHFCMGNIIAPGIVLLTTRTYSVSTAKHKNWASSSVNHMERIYIPHPEELVISEGKNLKYWQGEIKEQLDIITHPRSRPQTKDAAKGALANLVQTINRYLAVTDQDLKKRWAFNDADRREFLLYFAAAQDQQAAADLQRKLELKAKAKAKADEKKYAEAKAEAEKELLKWRSGKPNKHREYLDLPVMLRVNRYVPNNGIAPPDEIQTSKGARVSYQSGKLLYNLIRSGRDVVGHD